MEEKGSGRGKGDVKVSGNPSDFAGPAPHNVPTEAMLKRFRNFRMDSLKALRREERLSVLLLESGNVLLELTTERGRDVELQRTSGLEKGVESEEVLGYGRTG